MLMQATCAKSGEAGKEMEELQKQLKSSMLLVSGLEKTIKAMQADAKAQQASYICLPKAVWTLRCTHLASVPVFIAPWCTPCQTERAVPFACVQAASA